MSGLELEHLVHLLTPCKAWGLATDWLCERPLVMTGWRGESWIGTSLPSQSTLGMMCPTFSLTCRLEMEEQEPSTTVPETAGQCSPDLLTKQHGVWSMAGESL